VGTVQLIQELDHQRDGELVLGRSRVEGVVVDTETLELVRLANEEDWCGERGCAWADNALREHDHNLAFQLILLQLGVAVWSDGDGSGTRQEVYAVVIRLRWWQPLQLLEDDGVVLEKPVDHGSLGVGGCDRRGKPQRAQARAARYTTWRLSRWKTSICSSKS
jgi:hypothetical protein